MLDPIEPRHNDGILKAEIATSDGCQRVSIDHPMTKRDHLSYILAVGDDLVRIKRIYPEQEAQAEFPLQGPCTLYAWGAGCGFVEL